MWYYWVDAIFIPTTWTVFKPFHFLCLNSDPKKTNSPSTVWSASLPAASLLPDYSYGFQFTTNQIEVEGEENAIVADSLRCRRKPGLGNRAKTGWLDYEDGRNFITEQNYKKLYGSSAMELTVGYYDVEKNAIVAYDKPRQIASARPSTTTRCTIRMYIHQAARK